MQEHMVTKELYEPSHPSITYVQDNDYKSIVYSLLVSH